MKSRPILITQSILAGCDVIAVSASLTELVPAKVALMFILVTKAVQVGVAFYNQSNVVPLSDSGAFVNSDGQMVAGPASGTSNGTNVAVVPTDPAVSAEQVRAAQLVARAAVAHQPKP
jgi:hypothetical protein